MLGVPIMAVIAVGAKAIGHKRELFTPFRISVCDRALSLQELLAEIVTQEVFAFSERQSQQQLRQVLTKEGMETGLVQGKISSGEREFPAVEVNVQDAIAQRLHVSLKTAQNYIQRLKIKLGVDLADSDTSSRVGLCMEAIRRKLLSF
jgi:Fic family protein